MSREQDMRRVSDSYRDIARESSPARLDETILSMATKEARTRYGLARAWMRPVAWAATIALSFAFVLEMTYFSDEPPPIDAAMPARVDSDAHEVAEPASQAPAFKRSPPAAVIAAPEIKASDMQAAESRRERASLEFAASAEHCDAETRQSADTWYDCILALRDQGLDDAARAELDTLRETFPDFREPVPE